MGEGGGAPNQYPSSFSIVAEEHEGRKKEQFDGMDRVAYSRAPLIRYIKVISVFLPKKASHRWSTLPSKQGGG